MKNLINLERFKQSLINDFGKTLKSVDDYLQKAIFNREVKSLNSREIKQILANADKEFQGLFSAYMDGLKSNWRGFFSHQYQLQNDTAYQLFRKKLNSPASLLAYADKVFDKPMNLTANVGVTLDELTKSFSKNESERLIRAIGFAHMDGLTNDKLIQMIRGSKANHFKDGILSTTSRNAQTIARTGTAIMASEAKQAFIHENRDIIKGIRVNATLDRRTSHICRHLDHQFMPIKQAKYPPYHFNCRSSFEIVFDGYQSPKNRASEFGVTENVSYYEWLKNQDKAFVESILGKKNANIFLADNMTAERFKRLGLDKVFMPLALDELLDMEYQPFFNKFIHSSANAKTKSHFLDNANVVHQAEKIGLNQAEIISIMGYTHIHGFIQKHLYQAKNASSQHVAEQINYMLAGLRKLPDYQGEVIRRVSLYGEIATLKKGDIFSSKAFMSTTLIDNDDVFAGRKVRMILTVKTGKRIDWLSLKPYQKEVLIMPNTAFEVIDIQKQGNELWVKMTEK